MPRVRLLRFNPGLILLAAVVADAAPPRDLARVLPAETLVYAGWAAAPSAAPLDATLWRSRFDALSATGPLDRDAGTRAAIQQVLRLVPALAQHPCGLALLDLAVTDGRPDVQLGLVVAAGPQSAGPATAFGDLLRTLEAPPPTNIDLRGTAFQSVPLGADGPRLLWGVASDCLLVAVGEAAATKILAGLGEHRPVAREARALAKRAESAANLRQIGAACRLYAADRDGRFPAALDELVRSGIRVPEVLRSPRDPGPGPAYVYVAGHAEPGNPRSVLAYERVAGDEGTNVLFLDGHVEFMQLPEFEAALRATAERLGRPLRVERFQGS